VEAVEMVVLERTVDLEVVDFLEVKEPSGKGMPVVHMVVVVVVLVMLVILVTVSATAMEVLDDNLPSQEPPLIMPVVVHISLELVDWEEEAATKLRL